LYNTPNKPRVSNAIIQTLKDKPAKAMGQNVLGFTNGARYAAKMPGITAMLKTLMSDLKIRFKAIDHLP